MGAAAAVDTGVFSKVSVTAEGGSMAVGLGSMVSHDEMGSYADAGVSTAGLSAISYGSPPPASSRNIAGDGPGEEDDRTRPAISSSSDDNILASTGR